LQALSLLRIAERTFAEDGAKALLERRVLELEEANSRITSELAGSKRAFTELLSKYEEHNKFCDGLNNCNVVLRDERNAARANVVDLEEKVVKVKNDATASSAATKKRYEGYQAEVKKDLALLDESYEAAVNGIGGRCTPLDDASFSAEDFFCWFKSEVASLSSVFIGANDNFVSVALEGVLEIVRRKNVVDFNALRVGISTCWMTVFLSSHREVKRTVHRIVKDWWRQFGFEEAKQVAHVKLHEVSLICLASHY
jgi:hypothetical protein